MKDGCPLAHTRESGRKKERETLNERECEARTVEKGGRRRTRPEGRETVVHIDGRDRQVGGGMVRDRESGLLKD